MEVPLTSMAVVGILSAKIINGRFQMRIQEICKLNKNDEFYFVSNLYLKETKQKSEQESLQ